MATESGFWTRFACGGTAACIAEAATIPFDTTKVRMQIRNNATAAVTAATTATTPGAGPPPGFIGTLTHIAKTEGTGALFRGLTPGLQRQLLFGSIRLGLYEPIRNALSGDTKASAASIWARMGAGLLSGCIGILVANPTDVVKVRLQAELRSSGPKRYKGTIDAYRSILSVEGVGGMYRGLIPNIMRNSLMNMAELVTYDVTKTSLLSLGIADGLPVHALSATVCGLVGTMIGSPVDVIKTRVMNASGAAPAGVLTITLQTLKNEGVRAFYKGSPALFVRVASWNIVMFIAFEQLKGLAGL